MEVENRRITELRQLIKKEVDESDEDNILDIAYLIHLITLEEMKQIKEDLAK